MDLVGAHQVALAPACTRRAARRAVAIELLRKGLHLLDFDSSVRTTMGVEYADR
jgi:hypothetical protein